MPMANGTPTHNGQKTGTRIVADRLPTHTALADLQMLKQAAGRIRLRGFNGQRSVTCQTDGVDQVEADTQDPKAPISLPSPSTNGGGAPAGARRVAKPVAAH